MTQVSGHHAQHKPGDERATDGLEAASHSTADYAKFMPQLRPKRKLPRILGWAILTLLILCLVGFSGWWLSKHSRHTKSGNSTVSQSQVLQPQTSSTTTTQYVSKEQSLNLIFSYPSNWTVTPPTTTNSESKNITVDSVLTDIADVEGASVVGKAVITIRSGASGISELNDGTATAAQNSTQFSYSQPAADQLQYPYLSYIHFPSNGKAAAFSEALVTGSVQFSQGSSITSEALIGLAPVISVSFYQCTKTACSGSSAKQLSILGSSWQNNPVFQQAQTVVDSMQLH